MLQPDTGSVLVFLAFMFPCTEKKIRLFLIDFPGMIVLFIADFWSLLISLSLYCSSWRFHLSEQKKTEDDVFDDPDHHHSYCLFISGEGRL
ncbi:hypothetical protein CS542_04495 [Pedobacter sp. IW39]|nr:hypothetical protein CS542_04495 [Pedobacter sp. IW39]